MKEARLKACAVNETRTVVQGSAAILSADSEVFCQTSGRNLIWLCIDLGVGTYPARGNGWSAGYQGVALPTPRASLN